MNIKGKVLDITVDDLEADKDRYVPVFIMVIR